MKTCRSCGARLPLSAFGLHSGCADGHRSSCKNCFSEYIKDRRANQKHMTINRQMAKAGWIGEPNGWLR